MAARAGFTAGARARGARGALARGAAEGGEPKVSPTTPAATLEALERTLGLPAVPPVVEADDRARLEAQVPSGPSDGAPPAFASSAPSASAAAAGSEEPEMDFFKVMGFGAPAPEVINGRAAMVAFLAAAGAELATHDSVFKQLGEGGLGGAPPWWLSSRPPGPSSPRTTPSSSSWARAARGHVRRLRRGDRGVLRAPGAGEVGAGDLPEERQAGGVRALQRGRGDAQRPRRHDGLPHAPHPRGALWAELLLGPGRASDWD